MFLYFAPRNELHSHRQILSVVKKVNLMKLCNVSNLCNNKNIYAFEKHFTSLELR